MRDGVREGVWEFWTKCEGLRGVWVFRLVKRCICTFFFFFFEFRPDSAVSADTGRYGLSRPDLGRVGADFRLIGANFSRVGPIRDLPCGTTRHGRSICGVPPASPRRTRVRWPGSYVRAFQITTYHLGFIVKLL